MELSELADYFEQESKENIWETVTHDCMVQNIDELGASLEEYVATLHHATYTAAGSLPNVYEDLMYMGLQNSNLYQQDIVARRLEPAVSAN
jgi:hypothetical protein